jgi:uncharacterized protein (TIGR02147 family)
MAKHPVPPAYRTILLEHLQRRQFSNGAYSLRAFARDLKLSPASMSLILSGKQGLSIKSATTVSEKLALSSSEKELFLISVQELHGRSPGERQIARQRLTQVKLKFKTESESLLSNWLNIPLLEYLRSHPDTSETHLAAVFQVSPEQIHFYLGELKEKKILKKVKNKWVVISHYMSFGDAAPSRQIKTFHLESLKQAAKAIEEQGINERLASSTFFNINPRTKEQAFEALKKFRREFCIEYSESDPGNETGQESEVYCLSLQFFRTHRS